MCKYNEIYEYKEIRMQKKDNEGGGQDEGRKMSGRSQGNTSRGLKPKRNEVRIQRSSFMLSVSKDGLDIEIVR
jgi:hypothetical protein